jgi:hypothetical protein
MIPCVREPVQRLIETALTRQSPPPYPNNLLLLDTSEEQSKLSLMKFEENNLK